MGRARKAMETQTGDLTVERQQLRSAEEQLAAGNPIGNMRPPKTLVDDEAVKLWKWAIKQMKDMPLLCSVDVLNLEGMCNAFALYRAATEKIKEIPLVGMVEDKICVNPMVSVQKKYAEEYRAFARLCGFTVDSRLKLAAVKVREMDDEIEDIFGDV